jgi:hypothetical protein
MMPFETQSWMYGALQRSVATSLKLDVLALSELAAEPTSR